MTPIIKTYSIKIADGIEHGSIIADKETAAEGDEITLTVTPDDGYELEEITVNGTKITGNTFKMPAGNVTVSATFKVIKYKVTYAAYIENGVVILPESTVNVDYSTNVPPVKKDDIPGYENVAYIKYSGTTVDGDIELKPELWFKEGADVEFYYGDLEDNSKFELKTISDIKFFSIDNNNKIIALKTDIKKEELENVLKSESSSDDRLFWVSYKNYDYMYTITEYNDPTNNFDTVSYYNKIIIGTSLKFLYQGLNKVDRITKRVLVQ